MTMSAKPESPKHRDKADRKRRRANEAYGRLQRAATLTAAAADASLAPFAISASQLGVLETLQARGPLHQQELARTLGRSKAQMTAIIDALEKRALASRERHPTDRRFTTVHLTEAGAALLAEALPVRMDAVQTIMTALSGDQKSRLVRLCRRLIKALAPEEAAREEAESGDEGDNVDEEGADSEEDEGAVIAAETGAATAAAE
jgi:MarR family transcriptional regulator, 2-MHQ and catechol-resistance regulon repressor